MRSRASSAKAASGRAPSSCARRRPRARRARARRRSCARLATSTRSGSATTNRRAARTSARSSATTSRWRRWWRWRRCTGGTSGCPSCSRCCGASSSSPPSAIGSSSCTSRWRARPTWPTAAISRRRSAPIARRCKIDPANAAALSGLERLCRREGNWDVLAEALKRAPRSVRTVRALCEALEHLERWEELAESREAELALLEEPKEIARAARSLADLYERRLNDPDAAARAWHRVDEADPRDPQAARALERIYESRGRFADLAAAIERELQLEASLEPARRLELWLRLGEIRKSRLSRPESAAEAFENALKVDSHHGDALASLAEIYSALKKWRRAQPRARPARAGDDRSAAARQRAVAEGRPARAQRRSRRRARRVHRVVQARPGVARLLHRVRARLLSPREVAPGDGAVRDGHPARRGAALARLSPRRSVCAARAAAAAVSRAAGRSGGVVPARARARSRDRHGADGARAHLLGAVGLAGAHQRLRAARRARARRRQARRDPAPRGARGRGEAEGRRRGGAPLSAAALRRSRPTPKGSTRSSATTSARATGRSSSAS